MDLFCGSSTKNDNLYHKILNIDKNVVTNKTVKLIEELTAKFTQNLIETGQAQFSIDDNNWENIFLNSEQKLCLKPSNRNTRKRKVCFHRTQSSHRFTLMAYVLKESQRLLLSNSYCSTRELYYRDKALTISQRHVDRAVHDVSCLLKVSKWDLGFLNTGKGYVAGSLKISLNNGDIIDCSNYTGANSIPSDFHEIETLKTSADFVLLVEKDTVFKQILSSDIMKEHAFILITGRGYPDVSTRMLVQRLEKECHLPIYGIFDADPFGIEILLTYRHGSKNKSGSVENYSCSNLKWLGIHPCDLQFMHNIKTDELTTSDLKKLQQLLKRQYISSGIREELKMMLKLNKKAEIESVYNISNNFFNYDYIINKIQRKLYIL